MEVSQFPLITGNLIDTGERRHPLPGEQYMYVDREDKIKGPFTTQSYNDIAIWTYGPSHYAIYKENKVKNQTLGKFYAGATTLGKTGSTLRTYDTFAEAENAVKSEVAANRSQRYIVQVVAVVEPEPPTPPPTRTTIYAGLDPYRRDKEV